MLLLHTLAWVTKKADCPVITHSVNHYVSTQGLTGIDLVSIIHLSKQYPTTQSGSKNKDWVTFALLLQQKPA